MAKTNKASKKSSFDIYQHITDLICDQIAQGVAPWSKPRLMVNLGEGAHSRAVNMVSKKPYEGINALILGCSPYNLPLFVTFKQAQDLGGSIRKGAKSLPVVYWQKKKVEKISESGKVKKEERFLLRYYNVFNVMETDLDYSAFIAPKPADALPTEARLIPSCERIVEGYTDCPLLVHRDQQKMSYSIGMDMVNMPDQNRFQVAEEYYHIYFHELVHSTRHPKRLNRAGGKINTFGGAEYSKEELTAELGASFLSAVAGIHTPELLTNSAAYLENWLSVFKGDKKFLFESAALASKATKYILGETYAEAA